MGIKQNNEVVSLLYVEENKTKLPEWCEQVNQVLYSGISDLDTILDNQDYYIDNSYPVALTEQLHFNNRISYDYKYFIRDNYIHTTIDEGYIFVVYNSLPLDEKGEPRIEDEVNLINAIVWYNITRLLWKATVRNPGQYSQLYQKAEQEWGYYAVNAKTASIFPKNEDELKGLRNKFLYLFPNVKI